jgi:hypothetical protein
MKTTNNSFEDRLDALEAENKRMKTQLATSAWHKRIITGLAATALIAAAMVIQSPPAIAQGQGTGIEQRVASLEESVTLLQAQVGPAKLFSGGDNNGGGGYGDSYYRVNQVEVNTAADCVEVNPGTGEIRALKAGSFSINFRSAVVVGGTTYRLMLNGTIIHRGYVAQYAQDAHFDVTLRLQPDDVLQIWFAPYNSFDNSFFSCEANCRASRLQIEYRP